MKNIFSNLPSDLSQEFFEDLQATDQVRIERIVSKGHHSPESGWYDQQEHEWVIVLQGSGIVEYQTGEQFKLSAGDYLNIPAHCKHKVLWTDPDQMTLWLSVFYR